jgi:hypothetical protein
VILPNTVKAADHTKNYCKNYCNDESLAKGGIVKLIRAMIKAFFKPL